MKYEEARQELIKAIQLRKLPPLHALVLSVLAAEPDGFQETAAASILAASTNSDTSECSAALTTLATSGLIHRVSDSDHTRIIANLDVLTGSEEVRRAIRCGPRIPFEVLDAPHSRESMESLHRLFLEARQTLYVGLDVTSPNVFEKLRERAEAGLLTIFIMPNRRLMPPQRQRHYDEILASWVTFLKDLPTKTRQCVLLRTTRVPFRYLYTSALSHGVARFDCFWYDEPTTRRGAMLVAPRGSSLYDLVEREYVAALKISIPLWKVWPLQWLRKVISSWALLAVTATLVCLAVAVEGYLGSSYWWAKLLAAFLTGIAGEAAWEFYRSRGHPAEQLYER